MRIVRYVRDDARTVTAAKNGIGKKKLSGRAWCGQRWTHVFVTRTRVG